MIAIFHSFINNLFIWYIAKINFIEITKNQIQGIIKSVNYVISARTDLLEYLKKTNTTIETIDDIPTELIENLLKAKRQHIDIK